MFQEVLPMATWESSDLDTTIIVADNDVVQINSSDDIIIKIMIVIGPLSLIAMVMFMHA